MSWLFYFAISKYKYFSWYVKIYLIDLNNYNEYRNIGLSSVNNIWNQK
jgi:hypothetical protein